MGRSILQSIQIAAGAGFLLFCVFPVAASSAEGSLAAFQREFDRVRSFAGRFRQEFYDALLERRSLSEGTVLFKRPGLMRWSYQKPDRMLIVIGSEKIWIYDPDLENVTIQNVDDVKKLDSLSFLFKSESLDLHFEEVAPTTLFLDASAETAQLYLKPKKPHQNLAELQIALDDRTRRIKQFVVVDAQQSFRKITFADLNYSVEIDSSQFHFVPTEGMEIIEETLY